MVDGAGEFGVGAVCGHTDMVPVARRGLVTLLNRVNRQTGEWRLFANIPPETRMAAQIPQVRFPPFRQSIAFGQLLAVLLDFLKADFEPILFKRLDRKKKCLSRTGFTFFVQALSEILSPNILDRYWETVLRDVGCIDTSGPMFKRAFDNSSVFLCALLRIDWLAEVFSFDHFHLE